MQEAVEKNVKGSNREVKTMKTRKKTQKWQKLTKKYNEFALTLIVIISGYKLYFFDLSKGKSKSLFSQSCRKTTWVILTNGSQAVAV